MATIGTSVRIAVSAIAPLIAPLIPLPPWSRSIAAPISAPSRFAMISFLHAAGGSAFARSRFRQLVLQGRPFDLGKHLFYYIARDSEPDADVTGAAFSRAGTEQYRIDADELALQADQRAARIARIDRCIGLDEAAAVALP